MKIINVVGARPNFMKIAPIVEACNEYDDIEQMLVHTGQHYDENMSKFFFEDLSLPEPDIYLEIGSGSHAWQTARIMVEFEKVLLEHKPDLTLVVGDVNSTLACSVVSSKLHIPVAHVEAGLRSFDRTMPEEINRIITDAVSDYMFITEKSAEENLLKEGRPKEKIFFVGNVMIDTLLKNAEKAKNSDILIRLSAEPGSYALLSLHRPSNVDNRDSLTAIMEALENIQQNKKIICPLHPRTKKRIAEFGLEERFRFLKNTPGMDEKSTFILTEPLGYLDFMQLMNNAEFVLTDSGGIQEETTVLGIPCITLRNNTERPITVDVGTNVIVGNDRDRIIEESQCIINKKHKGGSIPELWDGKAADRIVDILHKEYSGDRTAI